MFVVEFDPRHRSFLVIFSGALSWSDVASLDEMAGVFVQAEGPHSVILDFYAVSAVDFDRETVEARGRQRGNAGVLRRVIVTPPGPLTDLARFFTASQTESGLTPTKLVSTRDEAFSWLGIREPLFRRVEIAWLRSAINDDRATLSDCG